MEVVSVATKSITSIRKKVKKIKLNGLDETGKKYIEYFKNKLILEQKSPNTIHNYIFALKQFFLIFDSKINQQKLQKYKNYLIENFSIRTIRIRIVAINEFLKSIKKYEWLLKNIKLQKSHFWKM